MWIWIIEKGVTNCKIKISERKRSSPEDKNYKTGLKNNKLSTNIEKPNCKVLLIAPSAFKISSMSR